MHVERHNTEAELNARMEKLKDWRARRRVQAIVLAMQGLTADEIAGQLDVSRVTVFNWVSAYNTLGLEAHIENAAFRGKHPGGNISALNAESLERLRCFAAAAKPPLKTSQLKGFLLSECGIDLSGGTIAKHMKRLGFEYGWSSLHSRHRES